MYFHTVTPKILSSGKRKDLQHQLAIQPRCLHASRDPSVKNEKTLLPHKYICECFVVELRSVEKTVARFPSL